jgi:hypothetical protein
MPVTVVIATAIGTAGDAPPRDDARVLAAAIANGTATIESIKTINTTGAQRFIKRNANDRTGVEKCEHEKALPRRGMGVPSVIHRSMGVPPRPTMRRILPVSRP